MARHTGVNKAIDIIKTLLWMFWVCLKWTLATILIIGFLGGGIAFGYVTSLVKDEPVRTHEEMYEKLDENTTTGFVYFNDDTAVGQLRGIDRRLISIDQVPDVIIDAFLATEDKEFNEHIGINWRGFLRAVKEKLLNEPIQTGGSTITQQVAKNVFLSLDVTDSRKAKEIFLALRLERHFSKEQIMSVYLNKIPFGNSSSGYNVYGIKAAATGIFKNVVSLDDLNIAQSAYLAGLPKNPSEYSAFDGYGRFDEDGFKRAHDRQKFVLKRMLEENKISEAEYRTALAFDIQSSLAESKKKAYTTYPYLMIETEQRAAKILLQKKHPELTEADFRKAENQQLLVNQIEEMLGKGYKIYTTIDKAIYDEMQNIAQNQEYFAPDIVEEGKPDQVEQIGAVMIDNQSGAILGMMEGRGFGVSEFNHSTQMIRQPGSTMKPIAAYLPAIEEGKIQPASIIDDVPIILKDGQKGFHLPNNWDTKFHGLITARTALNQSYNIPALDIFNNIVGIEKAWEFVRRLGITTLSEADNFARTGVIGGLSQGVTVEEFTGAYAAIANKGVYNDTYMIRKIVDANNGIIYEHNPLPDQVVSEQSAYLMTDMMRTVVTSGTGTNVRNKFQHFGEIDIVGKTGSTQEDRDAWFIGYTPDITVGVWAGYDQNHTLNIRLPGPQDTGTRRAMNIWSLIMDHAIDLKPELFANKKFEEPENIVKMTVSSISGKLPSDLAQQNGKTVTDIFNKKYIPTEEVEDMKSYRYVTMDGINYLAHEGTPAGMTKEQVLITRPKPLKPLLDEIKDILENMDPAQIPTKNTGGKMTLRDYYPIDAALSAPEDVDPRTDDGEAPAPPNNVELVELGTGSVKIKFEASDSPDVVGYRLYRSMNLGPYAHRSAQKVLAGDDLAIVDYVSSQYVYSYYLVSVDVAGHISGSSTVVGTYPGAEEATPGQMPDLSGVPGLEDWFPDWDEHPAPSDGNDAFDGNDESGEGDLSNLPSAPSGLRINETDRDDTVRLIWNANLILDATKQYHIYYSGDRNGPYVRIGTTNTTSFQYTNSELNGWYTVTAVNASGESRQSEPVLYRGEIE